MLENISEGNVLLKFGAVWCEPCKAMIPILDKIAKEFAGSLKVISIDIDEDQVLAKKYAIKRVPTVILIKNGNVVESFGFKPISDIREAVKKLISEEAAE